MLTKSKYLAGAILTIAVMVFARTTPAQMATPRIVTIDLNRAFNEYYKTPEATQKLKDTAERYNREHDEMMSDYRKLLAELDKLREDQEKPEYTAEVREQKKRTVQQKLMDAQKMERDIQEFRGTHRQMLDQQTQRMRQGILKEIKEVIVRESRDAGYTLVLDKSGNTANGEPTLIYSKDELDITDLILKILNKNQPAAPKSEDKKPTPPAEKK